MLFADNRLIMEWSRNVLKYILPPCRNRTVICVVN